VSDALLPVHVAAGGLSIVLGAIALSARKGGPIHRRAGAWFVGAMSVMAITAAALGIRSGATGNVFAAVMTIYFVGTALLTVRAETLWNRRLTITACVAAMAVAIVDVMAGLEAVQSPTGARNGVPYQMLFFLASIMALSAIGDVRVLRSGPLRGSRRLARHLWRMCFALFIAAGSFFSIEARVASVLPSPLTSAPARMLPILLVFAAMFYWLWKVRRRRLAV
jgi:hypothetical protein